MGRHDVTSQLPKDRIARRPQRVALTTSADSSCGQGGLSGPGVNGRRCRAKCGCDPSEIIGIAGENVVAKPEGTDCQVCVDHIAGRCLSQELTNRSAVIESVDGDRLEKCPETSLTRTSPHLCNDWSGCVECSPRSDHSC